MSNLTLNPDFETVLAPFGGDAENFFLAAGLYHAKKISFAAAAALAGLGLDQFHYRIKEHFGHGLTIEDETAREDLATGAALAETAHLLRSATNARRRALNPIIAPLFAPAQESCPCRPVPAPPSFRCCSVCPWPATRNRPTAGPR